MRRREFITLLVGATAGPVAARAQQDGRVRRIGILDVGDETDRVVQTRQTVLREGLAKLGWIEGRSVRFDRRYSADPDRLRSNADELVRLGPDVIAVSTLPATRLVLERTRTIPIVFTNVGDPIAGGLLKSIARPEGNATGATALYELIASKWLELLKEAAPRTERVALIFAAEIVAENYFAVLDMAADVLGMKVIRTPYRNAAELEHAIDAIAAEPAVGLLMVPPPPIGSSRALIIRLTLKYRLPTIYSNKYVGPAEGGLISYGADSVEPFRTSATYVDRILRGAKVSELPVQFPTKFELVINLKTARAIGLEIPAFLQQRADEVIE